MENLQKLISLCKASITIEINLHINYNMDLEEYISQLNGPSFLNEDEHFNVIENELSEKILDKNTLIELCFYPYTTVDNVIIYHWDIEEAVKLALEYFNDKIIT